MTTKEINEIKSYHAAMHVVELQKRFYIPRTCINAFVEKVAELALNREWAPFQKDLLDLGRGLEEYRIFVCPKTDDEDHKIRYTSLPESLLKQIQDLDSLINGDSLPISDLQQKINTMLSNPDWTPHYKQLIIIKDLLDELSQRNIDQIDRVRVIHLIQDILSPSFGGFGMPRCSDNMINGLRTGNIEQVRKGIETQCYDVLTPTLWRLMPLSAACSLATANQIAIIQLLIRAGAYINGGHLVRPGRGLAHWSIRPPLCDAFSPLFERATKKIAMSIPANVETHKKVLEVLLKAGANPNLSTPPVETSSLAWGFSTVLHNIIAQTDQRADELLPTLVDAGMNVDTLQGVIRGYYTCKIVINSPLMHAISFGCLENSIPRRVNFIRALIFNNAIVHEVTKQYAEDFNCLEHLSTCLRIRDRVLYDSLEPLRAHLPIDISNLVRSFWTPNVPDLRQRCYAAYGTESMNKISKQSESQTKKRKHGN